MRVMRYHALATDYDGTIATHGVVDQPTIAAMKRLRQSGRKLILVTGRELPELKIVFPEFQIFDRIVAENGALLYRPATDEERRLSEPPPQAFVDLLRQRGVNPLSVGRVIVATIEPNETLVLPAIRDLGLELQVIFNKGAVMILPSGVNKATGLTAALKELRLSRHHIVGVGDAENDHAFLDFCECGAAVANALPALKARADIVTKGDHGAGVSELIDQLIADDLGAATSRLTRHDLLLGKQADGKEVRVTSYGSKMLVTGSSGSGKSTFVSAFLEQLFENGYQACILDPDGDFLDFKQVVMSGDSHRPPGIESVMQALDQPQENVIVNLVALSREERAEFSQKLLSALMDLRAHTGRPHWIVFDEAHELLPKSWRPPEKVVPSDLTGLAMVTVHPNELAASLLSGTLLAVVLGATPSETFSQLCSAAGYTNPEFQASPKPGEALGWRPPDGVPFLFQRIEPKTMAKWPSRKYAEGHLPPQKSFYFQGPENKLNLRAQNLQTFVQLSQGIDDDTWLHHLRRGDYTNWFRTQLKDEALAKASAEIEKSANLTPAESRLRMRAAIQDRYSIGSMD